MTKQQLLKTSQDHVKKYKDNGHSLGYCAVQGIVYSILEQEPNDSEAWDSVQEVIDAVMSAYL